MKQKIYNVRTDKSNLLIYKDGKALKKKIAEEKKLQEKSVSITENGESTIVPDEGYDGIESVTVNVNVSGQDLFGFGSIGYDGTEELLLSDVRYSKTLYDAWDPTTMSANYLYFDNRTLSYAPLIDTSNVTDMRGMFRQCQKLSVVPKFNTSKVTNMSTMFGDCYNLTTTPLFNTSKVTNMSGMFSSCSSLITVPQFNTSSVTNMGSMFSSCYNLTTVPLLDASNVTYINYAFNNCRSLTTFGGLTDLGKAFTSALTLDTSSCPLSSDSVTNIANTVYDMNQNISVQTATIKFKSTVYAALTDEQKTLFANKNWTVTSA